jgi:hypothetical protein
VTRRQEVVVRTSWNVVLQAVALVLFIQLRSVVQGWVLALFVFFVIGPVLVLVPLVTAFATYWRGRLGWSVQAPFLAAAVCMVTAAALFEEVTDAPGGRYVPVVELFSPGTEFAAGTEKALWAVGQAAVLGYVVAVVWLVVALAVMRYRAPAGSA